MNDKHIPAPPGKHVCICVNVIDLGTHIMRSRGKDRYFHRVRFFFELPFEKYFFNPERGCKEPYVIAREFIISMGPGMPLKDFLESWDKKKYKLYADIDLHDYVGKPAEIEIVHEATGTPEAPRVYAQIAKIKPIRKGKHIPGSYNRLIAFSIREWDYNAFSEFPEWLQEDIKQSMEYKERFPDAGNVEQVEF